jgi:hypothetical protein
MNLYLKAQFYDSSCHFKYIKDVLIYLCMAFASFAHAIMLSMF